MNKKHQRSPLRAFPRNDGKLELESSRNTNLLSPIGQRVHTVKNSSRRDIQIEIMWTITETNHLRDRTRA